MIRFLTMFGVFTLVLIILIAIGAGLLWQHNEQGLSLEKSMSTTFTIKKGAHAQSVFANLEQNQLIDCQKCLYWSVRIKTLLGQAAPILKAGTYELEGRLSAFDILALLAAGKIAEYKVTLIEGKTLDEWLQVLAAHPNIQSTIAGETREKRYEAVVAALQLDHAYPEGLFLPETYSFSANTTDVNLLKRAYALQMAYLATQWPKRDPNLPLESPYEALILASIVEKETGVAHERPLIAGVFVHRLRKKMRLETDPTVIYGIQAYEGNITRAHLQTPTPYNTYVIPGLPPTPIAGPSRAAIKAALHPEATKALFFVAKGDGSHIFSKTYAEHSAAVKAYQLRRRQDYRSSPALSKPISSTPKVIQTPEDL